MPESWIDQNQRYLIACLGEIRQRLSRESEQVSSPDLAQMADDMPAPPAIERLSACFGLSPFERGVLLLCAGVELDAQFAAECAHGEGDPCQIAPTFGLALAVLPGAHWSALAPNAPLRYWRLIEVGRGDTLTQSPIRIDERVLHYLAGVQHLDERLVGSVRRVAATEDLAAAHAETTTELTTAWRTVCQQTDFPAVGLSGSDRARRHAVAAAACSQLKLDLYWLDALDLPTDPRELSALARTWSREAALSAAALLVECADCDPPDAARERAVSHLVDDLRGPVVVSAADRRQIPGGPRPSFEISPVSRVEQRGLCQRALGPLETLAQRISPAATWDDLVLPADRLRLLHELADQVHQRVRVYDDWGFGVKSTRGLGISALFVGPSGTGKTMAAEVLANALELDLYRIDLSQMVSKYIGETEKNLHRVFDAAEGGGAILLFDEADALFGKRSEVRDSHDRYANIEVSYLLQQMESYHGLAILTTNMRDALDPAFARRIRFLVQFPFPDAAQRAAIWQRTFPSATPTAALDWTALAQLNVTGGNIRNMALYAAFLAAAAEEPVGMRHLLRAAEVEYAKLDRMLSEADCRGWL